MSIPHRPKLRPVEIVPVGAHSESLLALRDPEGFGEVTVLPPAAAVLAVLMNGRRTLGQLQSDFRRQTGAAAGRGDIEHVVRRLDQARLLDGPEFHEYRRRQVEAYLADPLRPPSHAGGAYAADPDELRRQLDSLFFAPGGPGPIDTRAMPDGRPVCGIISPHIDLARGGTTYAWAYKTLVEQSRAKVIVVFGTSHNPMSQLFSVSRKDFATPLGTMPADQEFIDRLAGELRSSVAGRCIEPFADELAHRAEHSIEFQAVCLCHLLGTPQVRIVPILVGSLADYIEEDEPPGDWPEVEAFFMAVREAARGCSGEVCYVAGADLAHIGRRFGDPWRLDQRRLAEQEADDRALLDLVCRGDAEGLFRHVAGQKDRRRICGLGPIYAMLSVLGPVRGELLKYDQAVEPDGSSCVSFAGAALYRR